MEDVLVPIFICVVLPVSIVLIAMLSKRHAVNKKTEVMLKAIEAGTPIDPEIFKPSKKDSKTIKGDLMDRLTGACVTSLMGTAFLIIGTLFGDRTGFSIGSMPLLPLAGAVMLAVGISLFIVFFVGKKMLAKEIEAEEKALDAPGK